MERVLCLTILTRSVRVVVEAVSPLKCSQCKAPLTEEFLGRHVCQSCGMPQSFGPQENYFSIFGVPVRFQQDLNELEKRFYQVSLALHPDRFARSSAFAKELSLKRMSFLNQAYSVLKNSAALRNYLLELKGFSLTENASQSDLMDGPAKEIAEDWFELQDCLMEGNTPSIKNQLDQFSQKLQALKEEVSSRLQNLEEHYDSLISHPHSFSRKSETTEIEQLMSEILKKMVKEIQIQNYLKSIERHLVKAQSQMGL